MFPTYEDYLSMPKSLTLDEMAALHRQMMEETGSDREALALYGEFIAAAVKYMESRAHWPLWSREEKLLNDPSRTSRHNLAIIKLNQLARYLRMQGKPASWRETLGDETEDPYCRKRIGDFACYIAFIGSLHAR